MGEPTAPVVVAAFGVFEPGLIGALYEEARGRASREQVLAAREEGSVESLRRLLPDADVTDAVEQLRQGVEAVAGDLAGRPLFAGLVSLPWPADPLGQLWHAAGLLREYRGRRPPGRQRRRRPHRAADEPHDRALGRLGTHQVRRHPAGGPPRRWPRPPPDWPSGAWWPTAG
ncbi:MAG: hypothetical protein M3Q47_02375 [Actinomycetota bacterium]|nr:hypothetical protein [Actinomycetota bacterium]